MASLSAMDYNSTEQLMMEFGVNATNASHPSSQFEFNRRLLLNVLAYSVMFVVGTIGNVVVFFAAYRQHVSPENQVRLSFSLANIRVR